MNGNNHGTLPGGITGRGGARRGVNARWALAAGLALWACAAGGARGAEAPTTQPIDAPHVDWSTTRQVYQMIQQWVRDGKPSGPMAGEKILVSDLVGVEVTVRWLGLRMATGQATFENFPPTAKGTLDLTSLARSATRDVLLEVTEKLREGRMRAAAATQRAGGLGVMTLQELAPQLLVDVQVAHRLTPVRLPAGATDEQLLQSFAPGFDGLRLTALSTEPVKPPAAPQELSNWLWPADALAANLVPVNQVEGLLLGMGLKLDQMQQVARPGGPKLERFEVIHIVRSALTDPEVPLAPLVRGNVLLPLKSLDDATLRAMEGRMAAHLVRDQHPDGTFGGTYDPTRDSFNPVNAEEQEAALATYALARWAEPAEGQDPTEQMLAAQMTVRKSVDAMMKDILNPQRRQDLAGDALVLLTLVDSSQFVGRKVERDALGRRIMALRNADGLFRSDVDLQSSPANLPTQAMAAAALAGLYRQTRDEALGAAVNQTLGKVWQTIDPVQSVASLSWLMQADATFESVWPGAADGAHQRLGAERLGKLAPVIDLLLVRQVVRPPLAGPPDVVGGIELTKPNPEAPPNPDWHTAHVMAFLAEAIREPELNVGRTRVDGLIACGLAGRFLAQLMVDEPSCYYMRSPEDAIGGVRQVLWDNRLSPATTAMALLASVELRTTLVMWDKERKKIGN